MSHFCIAYVEIKFNYFFKTEYTNDPKTTATIILFNCTFTGGMCVNTCGEWGGSCMCECVCMHMYSCEVCVCVSMCPLGRPWEPGMNLELLIIKSFVLICLTIHGESGY